MLHFSAKHLESHFILITSFAAFSSLLFFFLYFQRKLFVLTSNYISLTYICIYILRLLAVKFSFTHQLVLYVGNEQRAYVELRYPQTIIIKRQPFQEPTNALHVIFFTKQLFLKQTTWNTRVIVILRKIFDSIKKFNAMIAKKNSIEENHMKNVDFIKLATQIIHMVSLFFFLPQSASTATKFDIIMSFSCLFSAHRFYIFLKTLL